ncbi:hypothetical protein [Neorhizobium sp. DT-125]|uniref:hypothetical protein n=1 Tax=Neorhizobium sp. DT-125 TaxID=3396163 RepID=UPI003F19EB19
MRVSSLVALAVGLLLSSGASASEEDFLKSIEGRWTGGGKVLTKLNGNDVDVSCNMRSDARSSSFSMRGTCRALAIVTRSFTADVKVSGSVYSGNYVGVSGRPSQLEGRREGNIIKFDVAWANEIYGDRKARMTIEKVGEDGLRIRTIDQDPESGQSIVTTHLDLQRH